MGDVATLRVLLESGHQQDLIGPARHRRVQLLCRVSDLMVRLKRNPSGKFVTFAYASRATALHAAALTGNVGALNLLLEHGADPLSTAHPHGATPLHLAAYSGHGGIVQRLLQDCPAGVRDKKGRTPSAWAKRRGNIELASSLSRSAAAAARLQSLSRSSAASAHSRRSIKQTTQHVATFMGKPRVAPAPP